MTSQRVALVIPTLNAGTAWREALDAVGAQSLPLQRRLIIDSSSIDGTVDLARAAGFEVDVIPKSEFNHGGTRQRAVDALTDCDIVVFLTQDAILADAGGLGELVACFQDPAVAVAYGRQLPHRNATAIEAHARLFNYGGATLFKNAASIPRFGTKAFFCSNSFAAYRRTTLLQLGGFRRDLILGEDAEFAARAILAGFANVYCATALVRHSHDYTTKQQFNRYFDIGAFEAGSPWMRREFGTQSGEGMRFVRSELRYLRANAAREIPRALLQTAAKLAGYRLGTREKHFGTGIKRRLSMSPNFWK